MAHLCCNGLVLSFFMSLVILGMLTDRAGCYNVREKKLIVRKLTSTVNSYGIATFSVRGEGLRFFDFLKCMNTIFRGFQMTATVLQHLRLHLHSLFEFFGKPNCKTSYFILIKLTFCYIYGNK